MFIAVLLELYYYSSSGIIHYNIANMTSTFKLSIPHIIINNNNNFYYNNISELTQESGQND